jgi:hypothetical protein
MFPLLTLFLFIFQDFPTTTTAATTKTPPPTTPPSTTTIATTTATPTRRISGTFSDLP